MIFQYVNLWLCRACGWLASLVMPVGMLLDGVELNGVPEAVFLPEPELVEDLMVEPYVRGDYKSRALSLRLILPSDLLRIWNVRDVKTSFDYPGITVHCFYYLDTALLGLVGDTRLLDLVVRQAWVMLRDYYQGRLAVMQVLIQNEYLGAVIGRGGSNIRGLEHDTGATIRCGPDFKGASTEKVVTVRGPAAGVLDAIIRIWITSLCSQWDPNAVYWTPEN